MWQYKYLAILESARDFTQMEWLMAQPPDACQRPCWRCYINHHSLSHPPSSSPSRFLSIFHTASSALRLLPSLSSRSRSALCGSANLLYCWISIIQCGVPTAVRQAKSEENNLTGTKLWGDWHRHVTVQTSLVLLNLLLKQFIPTNSFWNNHYILISWIVLFFSLWCRLF